jgi:3-hydroxyacyl-CoA dehydrogenase
VVAARKPSYYGPDGGLDPEVEALQERPEHPVVLEPAEVRTRVLSGLAEEARLMLDEGVVSAPEDLDLAMITGAGFSFWNGGLTMLLDREGLGEKLSGKRFH